MTWKPGTRTARQWLAVYVRGVAMGVAELVPGVSGGTIAFVTGIYDELVHTLSGLSAAISPVSLKSLKQGILSGVTGIWNEHNLTFLLVLGLGMITSVVGLAQFLALALETIRPVVWSFFLGIIILSIWLLGRELPLASIVRAAPVGLVAGVGLTLLDPLGGSQSLGIFFMAGAIAVSAWLLPAVSGSFMLLVLGLYESVIEALAAPHWDVLAVFLAGCVVGLLLFSRLLSTLLQRWRAPLLSGLTGFMAGASIQLWPWQVEGVRVLPDAYAAGTGAPDYFLISVVSLLAGGVIIWLLSLLET